MESYENRKKLLFDSLESAEKDIIKGTSLEQKHDIEFNRIISGLPMVRVKGSKLNGVQFKGKESIFKREVQPIQKCLKPRTVPDYKINPHNWKKYSLADVDISDKTNSDAAFNFLKEIEERKRSNVEHDIDDNMNNDGALVEFTKPKITFNKTNSSRKRVTDLSADYNTLNSEDGPLLKGSKLVMPEYVVGQKNKKSKKNVSKTSVKCNELKLDHLLEENDE